MKIKTIILLSVSTLFGLILFSSCNEAMIRMAYLPRYDEYTARYLQPQMDGFVSPTVADLNVSPNRFSYSKVFDNVVIEVLIPPKETEKEKKERLAEEDNENKRKIEVLKTETITEALYKNNADVIVGPIFSITTNEDCTKVTVSVTGYLATYFNFRKASEKDINLLFPNKENGKIIIKAE